MRDPKFISSMNQAIGLANNDNLLAAVELLNNLIVEFPTAAGAHGYLAWFLLELGQQEQALEHSKTAVSLAPNSEKASLIYFHTLSKAGRHIDALDEMKRFLAIRPCTEYSNVLKGWEPFLNDDNDAHDNLSNGN